MVAKFEIKDNKDSLSIWVTEPRSSGRLLLLLPSVGFALYVFLHTSPYTKLFQLYAVVFVLVLAKNFIAALRGTSVELRVGNSNFDSVGHAPGGYSPSSIRMADIDRLEFRKGCDGGDDAPELPPGLYVEYRSRAPWQSSTCVVPHISETQTDEAIEAIYRRFPDLGVNGSSASDLISLNLNQTSKK